MLFESLPVAALLVTLLVTTTWTKNGSAQTSSSISEPGNASSSDGAEGASDAKVSNDEKASNKEDPDEDFMFQPPVMNLETGNPLTVLMTPFHWGAFSLLSVSGFQGYDTNPRLQEAPTAEAYSEFYTSLLFSRRLGSWRLDAQYQPFVSFAPRQTNKSFSAASMDLQTEHRLDRSWSWSAAENLRYSPDTQTVEGIGLVSTPGGGIGLGNTFLSAGRYTLASNAHFALNDRFSERSSLVFHVDENFTRLSSYVGASGVNTPAQEVFSSTFGVVWSDHWNLRDTLTLRYDFRSQSATGTSVGDVDTQTASLGWGHRFAEGLRLSMAFGPGWSTYTGHQDQNMSQPRRPTLVGSIGLSKQFRQGNVALAFERSNNFVGVISDSFNNSYDLTLNRSFGARWTCSGRASYLQQQVSSGPSTTGEQASVLVSHFLSRNLSFFGQARYMKIHGSAQTASEKTVTVGFRWSWEPDRL